MGGLSWGLVSWREVGRGRNHWGGGNSLFSLDSFKPISKGVDEKLHPSPAAPWGRSGPKADMDCYILAGTLKAQRE